jgi:ribose 1,5-bisphosphate isomerase
VREAAEDRGSGAAEIADRAARALAQLPAADLSPAIETIVRGHPSMAPLWRLASEVLAHGSEGAGRFLEVLAADARAPHALAGELPESLVLISYSSSLREVVRLRRPGRVSCLESLPGGEGHRMAASIAAWTSAEVIPDQRALTTVPGEAVVVGADAVTPEAAINKVKTRALAEAALREGIPCYAVAGRTKFVAARLPVVEPFEPVPLELFTALATPDGLAPPGSAAEVAMAAALDRGLDALLETLGGRALRPGP